MFKCLSGSFCRSGALETGRFHLLSQLFIILHTSGCVNDFFPFFERFFHGFPCVNIPDDACKPGMRIYAKSNPPPARLHLSTNIFYSSICGGFSNRISISINPSGGAVGPACCLSFASMISSIFSGGQKPLPIRSRVPTIIRTIL